LRGGLSPGMVCRYSQWQSSVAAGRRRGSGRIFLAAFLCCLFSAIDLPNLLHIGLMVHRDGSDASALQILGYGCMCFICGNETRTKAREGPSTELGAVSAPTVYTPAVAFSDSGADPKKGGYVQRPADSRNGCGCEFDAKASKFDSNDPIQKHYKKTGGFGSISGAFGDKKTMYCHHMTARGQVAVRALKASGQTFKSTSDVWLALGKAPCYGRFAYDRKKGRLVCGSVVQRDHDNTCNLETCPFLASGLPCPTPGWAHKA